MKRDDPQAMAARARTREAIIEAMAAIREGLALDVCSDYEDHAYPVYGEDGGDYMTGLTTMMSFASQWTHDEVN